MTGTDATAIPQKQPDETGDPYEDYPDDEKGADEEELSGDRILKIATDLKGYGNTAFKGKKLALALEKYQKGLRYLHEYPEKKENDSPDLESNLDQLKITLHSNSAQCQVKMEQYQAAHKSASAALDMPKVSDADKGKLYYRRATASVGLKNEEEAIGDLEMALKSVPGDPNAQNELRRLKVKAAEADKKEKAAFKKFFQ